MEEKPVCGVEWPGVHKLPQWEDPATECQCQDVAVLSLGLDGLGFTPSFLVKCPVPGYGESNLLMTSLGFNSLRLRFKHIQLPHETSKPLMPVTAKLGLCFWLQVLGKVPGTVGSQSPYY